MDTVVPDGGLNPGRSWKIMQHVYFAALTLATDVSINPNAPDVEDRKAKVMAAYRTLENSREETHMLMHGMQKNMQTLLATLESRKPQAFTSGAGSSKRNRGNENVNVASGVMPIDYPSTGLSHINNIETRHFGAAVPDEMTMETGQSLDSASSMDWGGNMVDEGQIWSDFLAVAPMMESEDWDFFLNDIYTG